MMCVDHRELCTKGTYTITIQRVYLFEYPSISVLFSDTDFISEIISTFYSTIFSTINVILHISI